MARSRNHNRMTTGGLGHYRQPPAIVLNSDGSVQRDPQKDREERIRKMKAEFCRAKKMLNEALAIMAKVEETFLDLEPNFDNLPDLGKK